MFDELVANTAGVSGARAVDAWTRVESAACAHRLAAMVTMLDTAHAADGSADREQWCLDNWAAVCAHIGAAHRVTSGMASGLLLVATALRDRFPRVQAVFAAGLIDYRMARTVVYRGMLVTDPTALRRLDRAVAHALTTWEPMSQDKTEQAIDAFVERFDPDAVHRTRTLARSRSLDFVIDEGSGLASLFGTLFAHDAAALDARVDALAATVCPADPRTRDQRRADATGALAHGADRLACLCDAEDCRAAGLPGSSGVTVYVVAHHDTITTPPGSVPSPDGDGSAPEGSTDEGAGLDGAAPARFATPLRDMTLTDVLNSPRPGRPGTSQPGRPAVVMGGSFLPAAIASRAALDATIVAIVHPGQAPPEPRHTPSKRLADFIRGRDLTCRFPGCRTPAMNCDIDHAIPWPYGPTQASNLRCLCRRHHLLKTFWVGDGGWQDRQHTDGAVDWIAPDGRTHTTTPGSRVLFPELSEPTGAVIVTGTRPDAPDPHTAGLAMPRRRTTRTQDRARRIADERHLNHVDTQHEVTG